MAQLVALVVVVSNGDWQELRGLLIKVSQVELVELGETLTSCSLAAAVVCLEKMIWRAPSLPQSTTSPTLPTPPPRRTRTLPAIKRPGAAYGSRHPVLLLLSPAAPAQHSLAPRSVACQKTDRRGVFEAQAACSLNSPGSTMNSVHYRYLVQYDVLVLVLTVPSLENDYEDVLDNSPFRNRRNSSTRTTVVTSIV